jgi:hypothetical protein
MVHHDRNWYGIRISSDQHSVHCQGIDQKAKVEEKWKGAGEKSRPEKQVYLQVDQGKKFGSR